MNYPYCQQPIVAPVRECHIEQEFCSIVCSLKFVYIEPVGESPPLTLWGLLKLLHGAKLKLDYQEDDFAEEYFVGPFIVS